MQRMMFHKCCQSCRCNSHEIPPKLLRVAGVTITAPKKVKYGTLARWCSWIHHVTTSIFPGKPEAVYEVQFLSLSITTLFVLSTLHPDDSNCKQRSTFPSVVLYGQPRSLRGFSAACRVNLRTFTLTIQNGCWKTRSCLQVLSLSITTLIILSTLPPNDGSCTLQSLFPSVVLYGQPRSLRGFSASCRVNLRTFTLTIQNDCCG
jgi:hypothetical protein